MTESSCPDRLAWCKAPQVRWNTGFREIQGDILARQGRFDSSRPGELHNSQFPIHTSRTDRYGAPPAVEPVFARRVAD